VTQNRSLLAALIVGAICEFLPLQLVQASAGLTRGPYLQRSGTNNIVVRWRTDSATESRVRYGTNSSDLRWEAGDAASTTEHIVSLENLTPATRYYYSVGTDNEELAGGTSFFFKTAPEAASSTRIWVIGDSGTGTTNQFNVRNAYYELEPTRETDLWLMLGDNAYPLGTDSIYQTAVFDAYPELLRNSVLWPAIGNHEVVSLSDFPFLHIFSVPREAECGGVASGSTRYYSFDYANIHFICLDSETSPRVPPSPMLDWLERDLQANNKRWTIAFWHSPPYSRGGHDSDLNMEQSEMRQNAVPILENHGVDLVLCGHSHSYERSYLMDGNYGTSATYQPAMRLNGGNGQVEGNGPYYKPEGLAHKGTIYVVAGSSGQLDGAGTLDHPAMFFSASVLGSVVLDIDGGRLDARFLTSTREVIDHFTIIKGNDPANFRTELTITNCVANLTWPSLAGHVYTVYFSTNFTGNWSAVSEPTVATGPRSSWTGASDEKLSNGFFRIGLQLD